MALFYSTFNFFTFISARNETMTKYIINLAVNSCFADLEKNFSIMMLHFRNIVYNYIFTRDFFLLSISPCGSVFQLFLPLIIMLRQILSLKIKHRLLLAAIVESRVVMVFLV